MSESPQVWSTDEVRSTIALYFEMLSDELSGTEYKKAARLRTLMPKLSNRSKGAVEFKLQNISAILIERGLPYIDGYKPLQNYQSLLSIEVDSHLQNRADFFDRLSQSHILTPQEVPLIDATTLGAIVDSPPEKMIPLEPGKPWITRKCRTVDFVLRDAQNRRLGLLAESFVVEYERVRLRNAGRDDLAAKVIWASQQIGDGLGFDVISYDERDDSEKLVEVKATCLGKYFPFYVTDNEVRCSDDVPEKYFLYRLFHFGNTPRIYTLQGSLATTCRLSPTLFRATV